MALSGSHSYSKRTRPLIIIASIRKEATFYRVLDLLLGMYLEKKGARVQIIGNDKVLAHEDYGKWAFDDTSVVKTSKRILVKALIKLLSVIRRCWWSKMEKEADLYGLDLRFFPKFFGYSKILNVRDVNFAKNRAAEKIKEYRQGLRLPSQIEASHRRYFGGRDFDWKNPLHCQYAEKSFFNEGIAIQLVQKIIAKEKPDLVLTLDGIYSTAGCLLEAFKKMDVPHLIYQDGGENSRKFRFSKNHCSIPRPEQDWLRFCSELSKGRRLPSIDSGVPALVRRLSCDLENPNKFEKQFLDRHQNRLIAANRVVGIFPNLTWDGAIRERDTIFKSLNDWAEKTLESSNERSDSVFIFREHPYSRGFLDPHESCIYLLKEKYGSLERCFPNVIFLDGSTRIRSYWLIKKIIDCSVVYNGTLGVEAAYLERPVLFAGNSPYRHCRIGFAPETTEEYFNLLRTLNPQSKEFKVIKNGLKERAILAYDYHFYDNFHYFPILPRWESYSLAWDKYWDDWDLKISKLDPEKNSELDSTIDYILSHCDKKNTSCNKNDISELER